MIPRPLARLLLLLALLPGAPIAVAQHPAAATAPKMRAAAEALIAAVDPAKRAALVLAFDDPRRTDWHYTPRSRPGLSFAELDAKQREAVHALLKTALSAIGHRKVVNLIELELVLKDLETFLSFLRDPEKYSLVIFGAPDALKPWGWRFEGHHLSLNFTVKGDAAVADTPSFFGANPALVPKGPMQGRRVLAAEEDEARTLLGMLDAGQRKVAVIDARSYGDIVTGSSPQASPLEDRGLEARAMTEDQRAQLRRLIETYADSFEPGLRAARLSRVHEGDFGAVRFAWAGATQRGRSCYYRIQGAGFLIEFDASPDSGNHIHTVWRDFNGDFGRDLLREHRAAFAH